MVLDNTFRVLASFLNLVLCPKFARRIIENWRMYSLVVMTLKNVFRIQSRDSNMAIYPKIVIK
jgi:hypothetical protein